MPSSSCELLGDPSAVIHETPGRVVRRQGGVVMKSGLNVRTEESEALSIARSYKLPVPEVYETHKNAQGENCIHMEHIEGENLDEAWMDMTAEQKTVIASELRQILTLMAGIPSQSYIGSCSGGPAIDCRRYSSYTGGPFTSEHDFNAFVLDLFPATPNALRNALSGRLPTTSKIVFSHGDLARHNIIVNKGHVASIIDWEFAGWYPQYWDYIKFFERGVDSTDWKDYSEQIFPQTYDDILVNYQAIVRWQMP